MKNPAIIIFTIFLVGMVIYALSASEQPISKEEQLEKEIAFIEKEIEGKEDIVITLPEFPAEVIPMIESCGTDDADECLYNRAMEHNQTTICYAMETALWQGKCFRGIAIRWSNIEVCNIISHNQQKSKCVIFFALKYKDPALCEKIDDPAWQQKCLGFL